MNSIALLFDTGCFVLIWLVQLVIYPSFGFYETANLKIWHTKYTMAITIVVLPLMSGQLITNAIDVFALNHLSIIKFILVLLTWLTTFIIFVPLHNKINRSVKPSAIAQQLVNKNWIRTTLWTVILALSLVQSF